MIAMKAQRMRRRRLSWLGRFHEPLGMGKRVREREEIGKWW
jgi:hypothetical protein